MYEITVQRIVVSKTLPGARDFKRWARTALKDKIPHAELTIRIVDESEMTELNSTYRHKNKPTNVLSFPFDIPKELESEIPLLGDIVICSSVIEEEAIEQNKPLNAHWAHMVVHGVLHLLGYDHEKDEEADIMETEEIKILNLLGFENPYQVNEEGK